MTAVPLLAALVIVILFGPALLFATTLLERLIALPVIEHPPLVRDTSSVRINRKER